jgi:hypothetical protein
LEATEEEKQDMVRYFTDKVPHHKDVVNRFCEMRGIKNTSEIHKSK